MKLVAYLESAHRNIDFNDTTEDVNVNVKGKTKEIPQNKEEIITTTTEPPKAKKNKNTYIPPVIEAETVIPPPAEE
jgi:hypothetical protein